MAKAAKVTVHKSAASGRFVSAKQAKASPTTTYKTSVSKKSK